MTCKNMVEEYSLKQNSDRIEILKKVRAMETRMAIALNNKDKESQN